MNFAWSGVAGGEVPPVCGVCVFLGYESVWGVCWYLFAVFLGEGGWLEGGFVSDGDDVSSVGCKPGV